MREAINAVIRNDFMSFMRRAFSELHPGQSLEVEFYHEAICALLEKLMSGEVKRAIITLPPRSLKSTIASVAFPAYLLGHDPGTRIICASYAQDLAREHSLKCRAVMGSPWYKRAFLRTKFGRTDTQNEFSTTLHGQRIATSVDGTLTGRGGNIIIIDDPIKAQDAFSEVKRKNVIDWFNQTVRSRLDDPANGRILVVMQRVHMDDLAGHLIREGGDWTVLNLPAISPETQEIRLLNGRTKVWKEDELLSPLRLSRTYLDSARKDMGSHAFSAQYLQNPTPLEGNMLKAPWIRYRDLDPIIDPNSYIVQSWDIGLTTGIDSSNSVCTTWLKAFDSAELHLIDCFRGKFEFPQLIKKIVELSERHNANKVIIEDAPISKSIIQELRSKVPGLIAEKPLKSKIERFVSVLPRFEAGQVIFPSKAPWLDELIEELLTFPAARHDDQVDSVSQALSVMTDDLAVWRILAETNGFDNVARTLYGRPLFPGSF